MSHETVKSFSEIKLGSDVKVVLLDFDNTCYLYEPCHKVALTAVMNWFEKTFSSGTTVNFSTLYKSAQKKVKARIPEQGASHSRILYFKTILDDMGVSDSVKLCLTMEKTYWDTFKGNMSPVPGLMDFLALCRKSGTKVVVVSDLTTTIQCEKICHLGLSPYIDVLVTSEETGAEKPDSRCFELALEKVSCRANEAVVIGDSYERDIVGAKNLDIPSILITHENSTKQSSAR